MATRERPADRGRRRLRSAMRRLGDEHREARVAAGLSLRTAAAASGSSASQLSRFERGEIDRASIEDLGAWFGVVGMDLVMRAYPAGDPLRDRAQLALLERFRVQLHPRIRWRTEVALPIDGDLRAWDAEIRGDHPGPWRARVEAETRIQDGQAFERRLGRKIRDDPVGHVILLIADTRANRQALSILNAGLREMFPVSPRDLLATLRAGREPRGNGIVLM